MTPTRCPRYRTRGAAGSAPSTQGSVVADTVGDAPTGDARRSQLRRAGCSSGRSKVSLIESSAKRSDSIHIQNRLDRNISHKLSSYEKNSRSSSPFCSQSPYSSGIKSKQQVTGLTDLGCASVMSERSVATIAVSAISPQFQTPQRKARDVAKASAVSPASLSSAQSSRSPSVCIVSLSPAITPSSSGSSSIDVLREEERNNELSSPAEPCRFPTLLGRRASVSRASSRQRSALQRDGSQGLTASRSGIDSGNAEGNRDRHARPQQLKLKVSQDTSLGPALPCKTVVEQMLLSNTLQAFHRGYSLPAMVSRTNEMNVMVDMMENTLTGEKPQALYVCGAPGTGKTSTLYRAWDTVCARREGDCQRCLCYMNAAMFQSTHDFLSQLQRRFFELQPGLQKAVVNKLKLAETAEEQLRTLFLSKMEDNLGRRQHSRIQTVALDEGTWVLCRLVVVDEADQLCHLSGVGAGRLAQNRFPHTALTSGTSMSTMPTTRASRRLRSTGASTVWSPSAHSLLELLLYMALLEDSNVGVIAISNCLALGSSLAEGIEARQRAANRAVSAGVTERRRSNTTTSERTRRCEANARRALDVLVFEPYKAKELQEIFEKRLELAREQTLEDIQNQFGETTNAATGALPSSIACRENLKNHLSAFVLLFETNGVLLTLKKLSAHQGDCRQMLDFCREVLTEKLEELPLPHLLGRTTEEKGNTGKKKNNGDDFVDSLLKVVSPCSSGRRSRTSSSSSPQSSTDASDDMESSTPLYCQSPEKRRKSSNVKQYCVSTPATAESSSCTPTTSASDESYHDVDSSHFYVSTPAYPAEVEAKDFSSLVTLADTQKVLDRQMQRPFMRCLALISKLPLHQQILLCAVCVAFRVSCPETSERLSVVEVDCIDSVYREICAIHGLSSEYKGANLKDAFVALEQTGLLRLVAGTSTAPASSLATRLHTGGVGGPTALRKNFSMRQRGAFGRNGALIRFPTAAGPSSKQFGSVELCYDGKDLVAALKQVKPVFERLLTTTYQDTYSSNDNARSCRIANAALSTETEVYSKPDSVALFPVIQLIIIHQLWFFSVLDTPFENLKVKGPSQRVSRSREQWSEKFEL